MATVPNVLERGAEAALAAFVRRADDHTIERTVGSDVGLRVLFAAIAARFRPDRAAGFEGDIQYELGLADGRKREWTISVTRGRAHARPGRATRPRMTVKATLADWVRIVLHDLDSGAAVMTGRLKVDGMLLAALQLGAMFGEPRRLGR